VAVEAAVEAAVASVAVAIRIPSSPLFVKEMWAGAAGAVEAAGAVAAADHKASPPQLENIESH
jgi:hypothetical protein